MFAMKIREINREKQSGNMIPVTCQKLVNFVSYNNSEKLNNNVNNIN